MTAAYILAIDQGTTSTRAILFDTSGRALYQHHELITQSYPHDGWVEHDPEQIWQSVVTCCHTVVQQAHIDPAQIISIGITNQRETTILWDKHTGKAIYPAIVWQDRRTSRFCQQLKKDAAFEQYVQKTTGLLLDPYLSASKISWILNHVPATHIDDCLFGTVDSYLLWRLTAGRSHKTCATNASRTLLYDIHQQRWDTHLLERFGIPASLLPSVHDNIHHFGVASTLFTDKHIAINAMIGDQQAALIGQGCINPGQIKITFGTGCFLLANTGTHAIPSCHRLLTTIAYRVDGVCHYGMEGSLFHAGTVVRWLKDNLKIADDPDAIVKLAHTVENTHGVCFIPAFTGLGAPLWDPDAKAAIFGLTHQTQTAHIARAALESICYQVKAIILAMQADGLPENHDYRVDGGMSRQPQFLQLLANILAVNIQKPKETECSAQGAAYLAGIGAGVYTNLAETASMWQQDQAYESQLSKNDSAQIYQQWQRALQRVRST